MGDFNCEIVGERCKRITTYRGPLLEKFMDCTNRTSINKCSFFSRPNYTLDPMVNNRTTLIDHLYILKMSSIKWMIIDEHENCSDQLSRV